MNDGADRGNAVRSPHYVTLAAARALECNGCGDCCDSRRTDGFWTWGDLPADQYRSLCGGAPLIIPLERTTDGGWRDRPYAPLDAAALSGSRFRCTAFEPQPDGGGRCGRHALARPSKCSDFPVGGADLEAELQRTGAVPLQVDAFPRCTWYGLIVVADGDERLRGASGDPACAPVDPRAIGRTEPIAARDHVRSESDR